jgi:hypothetical protein
MLQHIHRIVPLHWAITSFYVLVLLAAPLMQSGAFEPAHGITSSLFLPGRIRRSMRTSRWSPRAGR